MADNDNERTVVSFGEISSDDSQSEVKSPFVKTLDSSTPKFFSGGLSLGYLVPVEDIKIKDPCEEPPIANKNVENTRFVHYTGYLVLKEGIKIKDACEEPTNCKYCTGRSIYYNEFIRNCACRNQRFSKLCKYAGSSRQNWHRD